MMLTVCLRSVYLCFFIYPPLRSPSRNRGSEELDPISILMRVKPFPISGYTAGRYPWIPHCVMPPFPILQVSRAYNI